jgi:acetyl esterase/lipase
MSERDRIDPESRGPLEALLAEFPGGFGAIADPGARRTAVHDLVARLTADVPPDPRVEWDDLVAPGPPGAADVRVRRYRPTSRAPSAPGVLLVHGPRAPWAPATVTP